MLCACNLLALHHFGFTSRPISHKKKNNPKAINSMLRNSMGKKSAIQDIKMITANFLKSHMKCGKLRSNYKTKHTMIVALWIHIKEHKTCYQTQINFFLEAHILSTIRIVREFDKIIIKIQFKFTVYNTFSLMPLYFKGVKSICLPVKTLLLPISYHFHPYKI